MLEFRILNARIASCREAGFSLFELVISLIVVSVLAAVLLNRLAFYQEMFEKAAMEYTLRSIKTGLQLKLAELIVTNRQSQAGQLETENPVQWLEDKPSNYAGVYREPPEGATWYFDAGKKQLVYVVNTGNRLEIDTEMPKHVRFQARLVRDGLVVNGIRVESVTGVALVPVKSYRWQ
jgi:prepilin-type N-terminal cleavage/methylation domain-containing protein